MWLLLVFLLIQSLVSHAEPLEFIARLGSSSANLLKHAASQGASLSSTSRAELLVFDLPLRPLIQSLQQEHGEVTCDCGMFVQIQARLKTANDMPAVLLAPDRTPAEFIACSCKHDLAYLRPKDNFAFQILQNSSMQAKGQWLLPSADGKFLGLLSEGPYQASEAQWRSRASEALRAEFEEKAECEESLVAGSDPFIEIEFIKILYKAGVLEEWTITPLRQEDVSVVRQRKLRRLMRLASENAFFRLPLRVP